MAYKMFRQYIKLALLASILWCESHGKASDPWPGHITTTFVPIDSSYPLYLHHHQYFQDQECPDDWAFTGHVGYRFLQSFDGNNIASSLFQYNPLTFGGADRDYAESKQAGVLVAENFGLASGTDASVMLDPRIQNHIIDIELNFALNNFYDGLYVQVGMPIVNAKWKMKRRGPDNITASDTEIQEGFMSNEFSSGTTFTTLKTKLQNEEPYATSQSIKGADSIAAAVNGHLLGDLEARNVGKIDIYDKESKRVDSDDSDDSVNSNDPSKWYAGNVFVQIGADAWKKEKSYMGLYGKMVIPIGRKLNEKWAAYTFAPMVGNGRHFELGGGLNAHIHIKDTECGELNFNFDGYLTHAFKKHQERFFDLKGKPMSRYMQVKEFDIDDNYTNTISTVADITSQQVDVYIPVKGELIAECQYVSDCWQTAIGYHLAAQRAEHIDSRIILPTDKLYGLKGDSFVSNVNSTGSGLTELYFAPHASAYIEDRGEDTTTINGVTTSSGDSVSVPGIAIDEDNNENLLLVSNDIDVCSGLMGKMISHRLYGYIERQFECECWDVDPFVRVNASFGLSPKTAYTMEYWDVGFNLGASF